MSLISIVDLEVSYHVGVPDEERAHPQRLLISVEMEVDFASAALSDRIEKTVDYFAVSQEILRFGETRNWKLIEKLAADLADMILTRFHPRAVTVEIKKFPIPQARHVSVRLTRNHPQY
jgi:FolB domain-containing protein